MIERPILFNAPMVRAILDGSKTQTRRPLYVMTKNIGRACMDRRYPPSYGFDGEWPTMPVGHGWTLSQWRKAQPGDRLWGRENGWQRPERTPKMMREGADTWEPYYFDADGLSEQESADFKAWGFKRRPSIHMPRWACRLVLDVTADVRIERLQDISEADAKAEGCEPLQVEAYWSPADLASFPLAEPKNAYRNGYAALWEAINGYGSWAANPWVCVIEFKRVKP